MIFDFDDFYCIQWLYKAYHNYDTFVANLLKRNYTIGRRIKITYLLNTLKKLSQQGFIHEKEN